MPSHGVIIPIQHERARQFFEEARHPDPDELRRRDEFLERLAEECPRPGDSGGLAMEIPDLDVDLPQERPEPKIHGDIGI